MEHLISLTLLFSSIFSLITFLPFCLIFFFFFLLLLASISCHYVNTLWLFSSLKKSFYTMPPSILPSIFPFLCSLLFLFHLYYILYQNFIKSSYKLSLFHHCCCCCCRQVASVMSDSVRPHRWQPTRLPRPWDSPGKNTGVGCHFLLQCVKVKREREVTRSCLTLHDPMDCSPPRSSIHGTFQARVLEWVAIAFSDFITVYLIFYLLLTFIRLSYQRYLLLSN